MLFMVCIWTGLVRLVLQIPRSRFIPVLSRPRSSSFSRAFHYHMRVQLHPDLVVHNVSRKSASKLYWTIDVRHIPLVVAFEFDFGQLMYGDSSFAVIDGCVQGSSLSPAICLAVAFYIEGCAHRSWLRSYIRRAITLKLIWHKWMDDVHALLVAIFNPRVVDVDCGEQFVADLFTYIELKYAEHFAMKVEEPEVFVGIRLAVSDDGAVDCLPGNPVMFDDLVFTVHRYLIQHWRSNITLQSKLALVQSLLAQAADRCSSGEACVKSWTKLLLEFAMVDCPVPVLSKAIHLAGSRPQHLRVPVLQALSRILQLLDLRHRYGVRLADFHSHSLRQIDAEQAVRYAMFRQMSEESDSDFDNDVILYCGDCPGMALSSKMVRCDSCHVHLCCERCQLQHQVDVHHEMCHSRKRLCSKSSILNVKHQDGLLMNFANYTDPCRKSIDRDAGFDRSSRISPCDAISASVGPPAVIESGVAGFDNSRISSCDAVSASVRPAVRGIRLPRPRAVTRKTSAKDASVDGSLFLNFAKDVTNNNRKEKRECSSQFPCRV